MNSAHTTSHAQHAQWLKDQYRDFGDFLLENHAGEEATGEEAPLLADGDLDADEKRVDWISQGRPPLICRQNAVAAHVQCDA